PRYEWTVVDYALWSIGAVTVPIFETSSAEQIEWILSDSGAKAAFVESEEHSARVESIRSNTPELGSVWRFDEPEFAELRKSGTDVTDETLEKRRTDVKVDRKSTRLNSSHVSIS